MKKNNLKNSDRTTFLEGCCDVRGVVTVDGRGQMVLPVDLRNELGLKPGERLAIIAMAGDRGETCCLVLIKLERLRAAVKDALGPQFREMLGATDNRRVCS